MSNHCYNFVFLEEVSLQIFMPLSTISHNGTTPQRHLHNKATSTFYLHPGSYNNTKWTEVHESPSTKDAYESLTARKASQWQYLQTTLFYLKFQKLLVHHSICVDVNRIFLSAISPNPFKIWFKAIVSSTSPHRSSTAFYSVSKLVITFCLLICLSGIP